MIVKTDGSFQVLVQVPSYALLSEICLIRLRGHLATLNTFNSNCGWLLGLCLGLAVPVQFYYPALAAPSLLFLVLGWRLPESPAWLLRRGREREARRTLEWLRGREYNAEPELQERAGNEPLIRKIAQCPGLPLVEMPTSTTTTQLRRISFKTLIND